MSKFHYKAVADHEITGLNTKINDAANQGYTPCGNLNQSVFLTKSSDYTPKYLFSILLSRPIKDENEA